MKKNRILSYGILAIGFILFNVLAFAIPTEKTAAFWVAYGFSAVAFLVQILIWKVAFRQNETLKSRFLGFPIVHIGVVYLIVQLIAFFVFMAMPVLPAWLAVVICALILGISAICLIAAEVGRDEIERVEKKVQEKVFFIKSLQVEIEMLAKNEADEEVKKALTSLAETIRFSDPMSSPLLASLEEKITSKTEEIKMANDKLSLAKELELLIEERNKKCKLLK